MTDMDSMLYWYPKIKDLSIPQPKTALIKMDWDWDETGNFIEIKNINEIKEQARKFDLPFFIRSDQGSAKHSWKDTCFVTDIDKLSNHILRIVEWSMLVDIVGLPVNAIAIREYIPMDTIFTAFHGEMPVNPEIRVFIKDGKSVCHHWYWIEDAIRQPSISNWREKLQKCKNSITNKEIDTLLAYASTVAQIFTGYWSVDFCRAKDKTWYLIDMATGSNSWHPYCPILEDEDEQL